MIVTALGLLGAAASCNKVPLVAPSGTVITLISGTNALATNGSTDITAVLIENGTTSSGNTGNGGTGGATTPSVGAGTAVHNGTLVTFATTLGRVDPVEARTTNGRATVKLIGDGRSGVATITALSGGASKTLTVNVGSAAAARILVTALPQGLPAAGGTSTISARLEDAQGNGISSVPVSFSTTAGTLANGTVLTDANGTASTTLTTTADATVTASAGSSSVGTGGAVTATTLTGTVPIKLSPNLSVGFSPAGTVTVSAPMTFTLTLGTPAAGTPTPVVTDVTVDFGDGETAALGAVSAASTTIQHMYGSVGTFTASVTAKAAGGVTSTVNAPVVVGPYSVTLAATGTTFGTPSTVTATVTPNTVAVQSYIFDFGDGTILPSPGPAVTHVYQSRGTKTIKVTVVPVKGPAQSAVTQIEIS